jgi:hypothetical protein
LQHFEEDEDEEEQLEEDEDEHFLQHLVDEEHLVL